MMLLLLVSPRYFHEEEKTNLEITPRRTTPRTT
jgi:hypothetical protein